MNKTRLYVAIMASIPFAAFSLGMGDMTVESSLNQPFKAEIQLFDVDSPLAGIKARLASVEDFERIGLDRNEILTLLRFEIKKNDRGQSVILISSNERIVEPFLEIVIDLTWANGQLYRAYTVLLDPPGYQLSGGIKATGSPVKLKSYNNEPGVINKPSYTHMVEQGAESGKLRKEATYGPTVANESIWQIAQRYTTPDTTIQQVILAIVGTNSQAFTQGNLNGLKAGERLRIPSSDEVKKVPQELARGEVEAHDLAWKNKEEINHVLLPPYIDGVAGKSQFEKNTTQPEANSTHGTSPSTIPHAPVFNQQKTSTGNTFTDIFSTADSLMSAEDTKKPVSTNTQPVKNDSTMKAEMDVTNAAIDSMRHVNSQLKNQLQSLENNNKALQEQMSKRDEDIRQLREQMKLLLKQRQAVAAQVSEQPAEEESSNLWLYLLLIVAAGGLGALTWFYLQQKANRANSLSGAGDHSQPDASPPPPPLKPRLEAQPIEANEGAETDSTATSPLVAKPQETVAIRQVAIEPVSISHEKTPRIQSEEPAVTPSAEDPVTDSVASGSMDMLDYPDPGVDTQTAQDEQHEGEQPSTHEFENDVFAVTDDSEKSDQPIEKKEFKRPLSRLIKTGSDYPVDVVGVDSQPHETENQFESDDELILVEKEETSPEDYVLDFEPSLEKMVEENKQKHTISEEIEHPQEDGLDFIPTPIEVKTDDEVVVPDADTTETNALDFEAVLHHEPSRVEPFHAEMPAIESPEIEELLKSDPQTQEDEDPVIDFDGLVEEEKAAPAEGLPLEFPIDKKPEETTMAHQEDLDTIHLDVTAEDSVAVEPGDSEGDNEFDFESEFLGASSGDEDMLSETVAATAVETTKEIDKATPASEDEKKLVKSKKALDTLMALAKTYISMDDHEAAMQSLQEIVEYGNKKQQAEAQKLLDEMNKK